MGGRKNGITTSDVAAALSRVREGLSRSAETAEFSEVRRALSGRIRPPSALSRSMVREAAAQSWAVNLIAQHYNLNVAEMLLVSEGPSGPRTEAVVRHYDGTRFKIVRDATGAAVTREADRYAPIKPLPAYSEELPDLEQSQSVQWDNSDRAIFRRLRGEGRITDGEQFELDGVAADKWFTSLGLQGFPSEIQSVTAKLFCRALRETNGTAAVESMDVSVPPHNSLQILHTTIFLRVREVTQLRTAIAAGLIANLLMHNPPVAVGASVAAALWDNIRRLSERELEVLRTMGRLTQDRPYSSWIDQERLLQCIPPPLDGEVDKLDTLIRMQSRGLLEEASGRWRVIF